MIRVSFILATFNRRDVLISTLGQINRCGLDPDEFEIHVVDNASTDGTAAALGEAMKTSLADGSEIIVHLARQNRGACAKNLALSRARGEYVVFLDDDSYPQPGSVERMIRHFEADPQLGAATFTVTLPNGTRECSAYPNICIGCGVGFRTGTIVELGGLPDDYFMQAEEYDLSLRLLNAGWDVRTFDDLHVTHLKTSVGRVSDRAMRLDVRNNLLLIAQRFPSKWALPYCVSWLSRYWMIAARNGQRRQFLRGLVAGSYAASQCRRRPISAIAFERFSRVGEIRRSMRAARRRYRLRSVLLVDVGKNVLAYELAARASNLRIVAIADDRLAGCRLNGVRVLSDQAARRLAFDGIIISNSSPEHAAKRAVQWRQFDARPVINLLDPANVASVVLAA